MMNPWLKLLDDQVRTVGRAAVSALYPNEVEYYMIALELTDSDNKTIDYLTFPVMPDAITKVEPNRNSVKKSLRGVTILSNPSFTPQEISIKGSFGKQFKILLNASNPISEQGVAFSTANGKYDLHSVQGKKMTLTSPKFGSAGVKTGYGVMKILKAMASKSVALGFNGKPLRLYFYNLALGESYMVIIPPAGVSFTQDISKNMIWYYNLTMIAVAPLEAVKDSKSFGNKLGSMTIQSGVNKLASQIKSSIL